MSLRHIRVIRVRTHKTIDIYTFHIAPANYTTTLTMSKECAIESVGNINATVMKHAINHNFAVRYSEQLHVRFSRRVYAYVTAT